MIGYDSFKGFSKATTVISVSAQTVPSDVGNWLRTTISGTLQTHINEGSPDKALQILSASTQSMSGMTVSADVEVQLLGIMKNAVDNMDLTDVANQKSIANAMISMPSVSIDAQTQKQDMFVSMLYARDISVPLDSEVAALFVSGAASVFTQASDSYSRRSVSRRSSSGSCCTDSDCLSSKHLLGNASEFLETIAKASGIAQLPGETGTSIVATSDSGNLTLSLIVKKEDPTTIVSGSSITTAHVNGDPQVVTVDLPTNVDPAPASYEKTIVTILYGTNNNPHIWASSCLPAGDSVVGNVASIAVLNQTIQNLKSPITVTISTTSINASKVDSCRWFNDGTWSQAGVFVIARTATTITCATFHLTSFTSYSSDPVVSSASVLDPIQEDTSIIEVCSFV